MKQFENWWWNWTPGPESTLIRFITKRSSISFRRRPVCCSAHHTSKRDSPDFSRMSKPPPRLAPRFEDDQYRFSKPAARPTAPPRPTSGGTRGVYAPSEISTTRVRKTGIRKRFSRCWKNLTNPPERMWRKSSRAASRSPSSFSKTVFLLIVFIIGTQTAEFVVS